MIDLDFIKLIILIKKFKINLILELKYIKDELFMRV